MAIEPITTLSNANFQVGHVPSSYYSMGGSTWTNPGGTAAVSQGSADGSVRSMYVNSDNNGGYIESKFAIQDGVGLFMGGSGATSGQGVVFDIIERSGEYVLRLRMPSITLGISDSWHNTYTEARCPFAPGEEVTFRFIASDRGFHVGVGANTLLELRRLGALRSGSTAPIFDQTRTHLGAFATKPGVTIKTLIVNRYRSRGKVYGGAFTTFEDTFNRPDTTSWNTSLAETPTGPSQPHLTVLAGGNPSLRYNYGGYLEILANTVPASFINGTLTTYSDTTANTGLLTCLAVQYNSGLLQISSNGNGGPYTIHINSTVTGASTGIAVEAPGGKGPNTFTAVYTPSISTAQWIHIMIYADPVSEASSSWQSPFASGSYIMAFHVTGSATPPVRSTRVGSFSCAGANMGVTWGFGSGASVTYLLHAKTYQLDMHYYDDNSGIVWSRTTPLPYTSTAIVGHDSVTIRVAHPVLGLDKSYNKVERG
jgi:hypothetical protein